MKYIIVSELVGEPGTPFVPGPFINIEALLQGGFIKTDTKPEPTKKDTSDGN